MAITEVGAHPLRVTSKEAAILKFKVSSESVAPILLLRKGMGHSAKSKQNCQRSGLWVVLLGPDGAGKSAVIAELASRLSIGFAGCESYHLRPAIVRSGRKPVTNCDPHRQPERGTLISVFKLVYLLVANWVSYLVVIRPKLASGQLVLFDRYFPDCLVDPRRYRLPQSCRWAAELMATLAPRPDLYLVLDAPASVLQERKCEVTLSESARQRQDYATCLATMRNAAIIDTARPLADVVADVSDLIIEFRLARYREKYQIA